MGRPTKIRQYTLKYVMRISEWIEDYIRRELIALNYPELVLSHCEILTFLKRKGAKTQGELARAIHRDKSTVSTLVRKLALLKLIEIEKNPSDGRSRIVNLTDSGRVLARKLALRYAALQREVGRVLNQQQKSDFFKITERLFSQAIDTQRMPGEHP